MSSLKFLGSLFLASLIFIGPLILGTVISAAFLAVLLWLTGTDFTFTDLITITVILLVIRYIGLIIRKGLVLIVSFASGIINSVVIVVLSIISFLALEIAVAWRCWITYSSNLDLTELSAIFIWIVIVLVSIKEIYKTFTED